MAAKKGKAFVGDEEMKAGQRVRKINFGEKVKMPEGHDRDHPFQIFAMLPPNASHWNKDGIPIDHEGKLK